MKWISWLCLVLVGLMWGVARVEAQSCTTGWFNVLWKCEDNKTTGNCDPVYITHNAECGFRDGQCKGKVSNAICGRNSKGECDVLIGNPDTVYVPCQTSAGGTCDGTYPACGGTCPSGSYCRKKTNSPECTCATESGTGCNGGYVFECRNSCTGYWDPGGGLSCSGGQISCRRCCTLDYPGMPELVSPPNGSVINANTVTLDYLPPSSWGGFCPELNPSTMVKLKKAGTSTWSEVARNDEAVVESTVVEGANVVIRGQGFFVLQHPLIARIWYHRPHAQQQTQRPRPQNLAQVPKIVVHP